MSEHALRAGALCVLVLPDATTDTQAAAVTAQAAIGLPADRVQVIGVAACGAAANRVAQEVDGEFLAFVAAHHAPRAAELTRLVEVLERDVGLAGVGPAPLDGDSFGRDVLALSADFAVLRHAAFRAAGGFDPSLDGVLDDVDLGWRLTLLGYRLQQRPEVRLAVQPRLASPRALARARLTIAYRNLGAQHLPALLAAGMGGVLGGPGAVDAGPTEGQRSDSPGSRAVAVPRSAGDGVRDFLDELPTLVSVRQAVQRARVVDDRQVLRMLADSGLGLTWNADVLAATGDRDVLDTRRRVLVVTGDTLGSKMAGPAIRAWEIAHALAAEHEVVLAAMGECTISSPTVDCRSVNGPRLKVLVDDCDVLIFQGFLLRDHPWVADTSAVLVADMYDPVHLEVLEQERHRPRNEREAIQRDSVDTVNAQLRRADFFLCASPKQRDFWLGHLASLGRVGPATYDGDEDLERLVAVVPFGIPTAVPEHTRPVLKGVVPGIGADDKVILWGGGIYNWFDPLTLLRAVDRVRQERPDVRLYFLGTKHPNPAVPAMRMATQTRELAAELGLTDTHVFFNEDWVAYGDRQNYLLEADIGVSCHYRHVETAFSFRTRILDYLWAGLPIVTTEGDAFGDLVTAHDLGAAVPAEDADALAAALLRLLDDEQRAAACRARVAQVAPDYVWGRALEPLVRFCRDPRPAADRVIPPALAAPPRRLPRVTREDLRLIRHYLRTGGVRDVARRVAVRLRRQLARRA